MKARRGWESRSLPLWGNMQSPWALSQRNLGKILTLSNEILTKRPVIPQKCRLSEGSPQLPMLCILMNTQIVLIPEMQKLFWAVFPLEIFLAKVFSIQDSKWRITVHLEIMEKLDCLLLPGTLMIKFNILKPKILTFRTGLRNSLKLQKILNIFSQNSKSYNKSIRKLLKTK